MTCTKFALVVPLLTAFTYQAPHADENIRFAYDFAQVAFPELRNRGMNIALVIARDYDSEFHTLGFVAIYVRPSAERVDLPEPIDVERREERFLDGYVERLGGPGKEPYLMSASFHGRYVKSSE